MSKITFSLQVGASLLIASAMLYGFKPVQAIQEQKTTEIPQISLSTTPTFPPKDKVDQVPIPIVEPPQKALETAVVNTSPSDNETIAWNFLISQGFNRIQTAGIMGNLKQEHGFNTDGDGLAQWTDGRKANVMSRANPLSIHTQLQYLMEELNGGYIAAKNAILASGSVEGSTVAFQNLFERCGDCRESKRIAYGYEILGRH